MQVFLMTFVVFALAVTGLALGWLMNEKKVLKGSCGGLSAIPGMGKSDCSCASPCEKRRQRMAEETTADNSLAHDEKVIEFRKG